MWNSKATVEEYPQINRENYTWFLKRNFRYGYSGLIIDKNIYGEKIGYCINILKSAFLFSWETAEHTRLQCKRPRHGPGGSTRSNRLPCSSGLASRLQWKGQNSRYIVMVCLT